MKNTSFSGRCYCGKIGFEAQKPPRNVVYCHCTDCRRAAGAPVTAFAEYLEGEVEFSGIQAKSSKNAQAERQFCPDCGTHVLARYVYLPKKIYIGVGLFEDIDALPPTLHAHAGNAPKWLHIDDNLPRAENSSRDILNSK